MKKKLLKILLVLVLFFCFSVSVNAAELGDNWTKDEGVTQTFSVDNKVVTFGGSGTINITNDFSAFIVISEGADITINLNGHTITMVSENADGITTDYLNYAHVRNYGKLTINGDGTLVNNMPLPFDNGLFGSATLLNLPGAVMTLNGGTYTRAKVDDVKINCGYVIRNMGEMTIDGDVTVNSGTAGTRSVLISTGWNLDDDIQNFGYANPNTPIKLVINSGEFFGGRRSMNTEGNAITTINGGTFNNDEREVIKSASTTIINNGLFMSPTGVNAIAVEGTGTFEIVNGTFSSDVSSYMNEDSVLIEEENGDYVVAFIYADYSKAYDLLFEFEDKDVSIYTEESLKVFYETLDKMNFDLGKSEQATVDEMTKELETAFNQLKLIENPKTTNNLFTYILSAIIMIVGVNGILFYSKKRFN